MIFHEEQRLSQSRTRILTAIPPVGISLLLLWQVVLGHPWGKNPMSNGSVIGWTIFLWLIYLRLITIKLITEVRPGEVLVALRGFWRSQRIPLSTVQSVHRVSFNPLTDWGGYGIRMNSRGKAYIAGGNEGIELQLIAGGILLIGSQKLDQLIRAVEEQRRAS
jgi:hypothetical protein